MSFLVGLGGANARDCIEFWLEPQSTEKQEELLIQNCVNNKIKQ